MACLGYFSKNKSQLRMPRSGAARDNLGVSWKGRVLTGEQGPEEALGKADTDARQKSANLHQRTQFGRPMEILDPVLQSHLDTK